MNGGIYVKTKT